MGKYNFTKDLEEAKKIEELVGELLISRGAYNLVYNNDGRYDILYEKNGKSHTVEIKHDQMYNKTNNVAIEVYSRGKASGISTSIADYWCYVLGEEVYFCKTSRLRLELILRHNKIVSGGDNGTSSLVLLTLPTFKQIFNIVS